MKHWQGEKEEFISTTSSVLIALWSAPPPLFFLFKSLSLPAHFLKFLCSDIFLDATGSITRCNSRNPPGFPPFPGLKHWKQDPPSRATKPLTSAF